MTKHIRLYAFFIVLSALFLACPNEAFAQQRLARTISPSMVLRILGFQDIKPEDLHNLQRLYESTGWKILKMDDDPSDGEMAVWGGRNMELSLDEFAVVGTEKPNNGIFIHIVKVDGFRVDFIKIVFNDENEENLFKSILPRYGISRYDDDEYDGTVTLESGQKVDIDCTFGYESMNPKVEIKINKE